MEHTYPCKICLVVACCSIYCIEHFKFINRIADEMPLMTADQIKEYKESVPVYVERKITEFYYKGARYAFPNDWNPGTHISRVVKTSERGAGV